MALRRGTIRTELQVEGTDKAKRNLVDFKDEFSRLGTTTQAAITRATPALTGMSRSISSMRSEANLTTDTFRRLHDAFTPLRNNLELVNQFRSAFGQWTQAVRMTGEAIEFVIQHNSDLRRDQEDLERATDRVVNAFARSIEKADILGDSMRLISSAMWGLERAADLAGPALRSALDAAAQVAGTIAGSPALGLLLQWAAGEGLRGAAPARRGAALDKEGQQQALADLADATAEAEALLREPERPRRGGGGRRRQAREPDMVFLTWEEEGAAAIAAIQAEQEAVDTALQDLSRYEAAAEEELNAQARASTQAWVETMRQRRTAETELYQSRLHHAQAVAEFEERIEQRRIAKMKEVTDKVAGYGDALTTVGGAVADVFGQLASEQQEGSKAAERYKKIQGGILAGIAFVNAALEVARAIGSVPDFVGVAAHAASAVAYVAAGVLALRNLGGNAQRPAASSSVRASKPSEKSKGGEGGGTGATILTLGWGQGRLAREMVRAVREGPRYGLDRAMAGAGGYS